MISFMQQDSMAMFSFTSDRGMDSSVDIRSAQLMDTTQHGDILT
jgi:hypothetical protein